MKGRLDYTGRNSIILRTMASRYMLTRKTDDGCDRYHRRQHKQATRALPARTCNRVEKTGLCVNIHNQVFLTTGCQFQSLPVSNENRVIRQTNDLLPFEISKQAGHGLA